MPSANKTPNYNLTQYSNNGSDKISALQDYNEDMSKIDTALNNNANNIINKADKATTYTKTDVDGKLDTKADKATTYTKDDINGKVTAIEGENTALENRTPDRISVVTLGADVSGVNDSTSAFVLAINQANTDKKDIYVPYGTYKITGGLPKIKSGVMIYGESSSRFSRGSTISDQRADDSGYLFDFDYEITGGGISNLAFDGNGKHNSLINITDHPYGWDGNFNNLAIMNYASTVINIDCNDTNWTNILITNCGGISGTTPEYAISFSGTCNRNTFDKLHVEHTRFMVSAVNVPFLNHIVNSKFELSTQNMVSSTASPININTTGGQTPITFTNCDFVDLDIRVFAEANSSNYDVPPMIFSNASTIIHVKGCRFMQGAGSGGSVTNYQGQVRWIRAYNGIVSGNVFYHTSYMVPSIEILGSAVFSGNYVSFTTGSFSEYEIEKQINVVGVRTLIGGLGAENRYSGTIPDGYEANNSNYGVLLTASRARNSRIKATGSIITWVFRNLNTAIDMFTSFSLSIKYAGTLGVMGRVDVRAFHSSGGDDLKLTNVSLFSNSNAYKTIHAYLMKSGDIIVQFAANSNQSITIQASGIDLEDTTNYVDNTILEAPTENVIKSTTLDLSAAA